jgi:hypothetical protein
MRKKRVADSTPDADKARSGLTLDNLEYRVESLRIVSDPVRKERAAANTASRKASVARRQRKKTKA